MEQCNEVFVELGEEVNSVDHGGGVDLFALNIDEKGICYDVQDVIWYFYGWYKVKKNDLLLRN